MLLLARFVFDPVKLEKRKLTRAIFFPDRLEAGAVPVTPGATSPARVLTAVICHVGPSAYGGHYVVYVRKAVRGGCADGAIAT